jgi:hypothetical protein
LKPKENLAAPRSLPADAPATNGRHEGPAAEVCCAVAAYATARATSETLIALRQQPGPAPGEPLPPAFLKHADEQTVVGIAALLQAIARFGLTGTDFTHWGALAAPRFLGRAALRLALQRFAAEGAWGISPHLIPHRSLHSISGTVSQALKLHGPNFGVGGGPGGAAEAIQTAAALLQGDRLPGVWVVWTGWNPEPTPELNGHAAAAEVSGAALALVADAPAWHGPRLRVGANVAAERARANGRAVTPLPFTLEALLAVLAGANLSPRTLTWQLNEAAWAAWDWGLAARETRL